MRTKLAVASEVGHSTIAVGEKRGQDAFSDTDAGRHAEEIASRFAAVGSSKIPKPDRSGNVVSAIHSYSTVFGSIDLERATAEHRSGRNLRLDQAICAKPE